MGPDERGNKMSKKVSFSVISVGGTRTDEDDICGNMIVHSLESAGHALVRKVVVGHDASEIQRALRESIEDPRTQAIVINGGTGVGRRDVTIEAVSHFEEKALPGFGELFRMLSFQEMGSAAVTSRAMAFVSEGKVVFCLPASEAAVKLAVEKLVGPEMERIVWQASV